MKQRLRVVDPPPKFDERTLDERLREYAILRVRKQHVMSQKDFAEAVGRDEPWAAKYLTHKAPAGSLETSVRIARVLNVNLAQLTGIRPLPVEDPLQSQKFLKQLHRVWAQISDQMKPRALSVLRQLATLPPPEEE